MAQLAALFGEVKPQRDKPDTERQTGLNAVTQATALGLGAPIQEGTDLVKELGLGSVAEAMKAMAENIDASAFKDAAESAATDLATSHTAFNSQLNEMTSNVQFVVEKLRSLGVQLGLMSLESKYRNHFGN
jgi:hypothetical protein